jgi:hypothetical protein
MGAFKADRVVEPWLYIFFKTEQKAGQNAHIVVRAPKEADPEPAVGHGNLIVLVMLHVGVELILRRRLSKKTQNTQSHI